jgi:hypothetical protein
MTTRVPETPMRKTAVRMAEATWQALKIRAVQEQTTVQQLLGDLVTAHLKTPVKPVKSTKKP